MLTLPSSPPRFEAETKLGPVGKFYSPAVALWYERLVADLILTRSKRTGDTEAAVIAHFTTR